MWLSAAAARSADPEQKRLAEKALKRVVTIMPPQWATDLDKKVEAHLKEFAD